MNAVFGKPSAREIATLIVLACIGYLWWAEHRSHARTQEQLKAFQGWSADLSNALQQERELVRQREEETRTWTAKSFEDEEDPFGK